jgi:hypothetical protein
MKRRIVGLGLGAALVTALAFALAPALAMTDLEPNDGIEQAEGPLVGDTRVPRPSQTSLGAPDHGSVGTPTGGLHR